MDRRFRRRTDLLGSPAIVNVNQFGSHAIVPYFSHVLAPPVLENESQFGAAIVTKLAIPTILEHTTLVNMNQFGANAITPVYPIILAQTTFQNPNQFGAIEIGPAAPPNDAPDYVNRGTFGSNAFGSSVTPGMPASLVTGNILIGVVACAVAGGTRTFVWPMGWNVIDDHASTGMNASVAWKLVDGTEGSNITISWTGGNTSGGARLYQYSGNLPSAPIGNHDEQHSNSGVTTWSLGSINSSAKNSKMVAIATGNTSSAFTQPAGWDVDSSGGDSQAIIYVVSKDVGDLGDPSGAISASKGNTAYASFVFELKAN